MNTQPMPWWKPTRQTRSLMMETWLHAPLVAVSLFAVPMLVGVRQIAAVIAVIAAGAALYSVANAAYATARRLPIMPSTARWVMMWMWSSLASGAVYLMIIGEPDTPLLVAVLTLASLPAMTLLRRIAAPLLDTPS